MSAPDPVPCTPSLLVMASIPIARGAGTTVLSTSLAILPWTAWQDSYQKVFTSPPTLFLVSTPVP